MLRILLIFSCIFRNALMQTCNWVDTPNTQAYNGILQPYSDITSCKAACAASPTTCQAINFDSNILSGYRCFFFASSSVSTISSKFGITWSVCTQTGCSWVAYPNMQSYGGTPRPSISTLGGCQTDCQSTAGCQAIEWVPGNSFGSQCFQFTSSSPPTNTNAIGITHYICSAVQSGCTWQPYLSSQSYGGTYQAGVIGETPCKALCLTISTCKAVEIDLTNNYCYTFTVADPPTFSNRPSINHFVLLGCSGSSTPYYQNGGCVWTPYYGYQAYGGVSITGITTLQDCQNYCIGTGTCKAIEWVPANIGAKCFTFTTTTVPTMSGKTGIDHYICNSACTWIPYLSSQMFGGNQYFSASTLDQCKSFCASVSYCKAIEFVNITGSIQCFTFNTSNAPTLTNKPGIDHYVYNCGSTTSYFTQASTVYQTVPACANNTILSNSNTIGGLLQSTVTTVDDCRKACLQYLNCQYGFDFNNLGGLGSQCYISTNSFLNNGNIPGVDHYYCN